MNNILILGAGEMQIPIIVKAKEMSLFTIVVDFDDNAPGFDHADVKKVVSTNDFERVLQIAKDYNVSGILTTSDLPVKVVAKVANKLGLTAMSEEVANLCTNKFFQREFLAQKGIKTPKYNLITKKTDLDKINFFPCVIKPVDSSASRGVKKVETAEAMRAQYDESLKYSKSELVIIEEYVQGREFSVETLSQKGKTHVIAVTEKKIINSNNGYFVEDAHIIPAKLTNQEYQLISEEVVKVLSSIGLNNAPSHTELKINSEGVFIIEIACRLGGDYITSDLVVLSTGVDMLKNLILLSLNKEIEIDKKNDNISSVQFLNQYNYESCQKFINSNPKELIRHKIENFHQNEIKSSFDRMGYIIFKAKTIEEFNLIQNTLNRNKNEN